MVIDKIEINRNKGDSVQLRLHDEETINFYEFKIPDGGVHILLNESFMITIENKPHQGEGFVTSIEPVCEGCGIDIDIEDMPNPAWLRGLFDD